MYDNIVIPTDGSAPTRAAIDEGLELARQMDATVHALYVVEPIPLGGFGAGGSPASAEWDTVVEKQEYEGQEAVDEVVDRGAELGVDVRTSIEYGKPNEAILEYVEEAGIDAIVMGTHGRSGAGRVMLGSVTENVIRKSDVPVLTVRMAE